MIKKNLRLIINNLLLTSIEVLYFLYALLENDILGYVFFGIAVAFLFIKVLLINDKYNKKFIILNDSIIVVGIALIFLIVMLITQTFTFNFSGKIIFNIFFVIYLLNIILIDISIFKSTKKEESK